MGKTTDLLAAAHPARGKLSRAIETLYFSRREVIPTSLVILLYSISEIFI